MKLWSNSFRDGGLIPAANAFAVIDPLTHVQRSANRNPHLAWDEVPNGSASLVLFCYDRDAPCETGDANREDRMLAQTLPRCLLFHWIVIDLPVALQSIAEGQCSRLTAVGGAHRPKQGVNDCPSWFVASPQPAGDHCACDRCAYDGPCPPWNDERIHHYIFRLYALDVPRLALETPFTGQQAYAAIYGHILDEAQLVGAYSLNPELAITLKK